MELAHDTRGLVSQVKNKRKLVDASQHIQVVKIIRCKEGIIPSQELYSRGPGVNRARPLAERGLCGEGPVTNSVCRGNDLRLGFYEWSETSSEEVNIVY